MYPIKTKKGLMSTGGGYVIFFAIVAAVAYGINQGLRIEDSIVEPGAFISDRHGYASRESDMTTRYCRYLTWSGIEDRVYRYRYDDPQRQHYCPLLLSEATSSPR